MSIRDNIARRTAGGPEFRLLPQRIIVEVEDGTSVSKIADTATSGDRTILSQAPVNNAKLTEVANRIDDLGFEVKQLSNLGALVAETDSLQDVIDEIESASDVFSDRTVKRVNKAVQRAQNKGDTTIVGGFKPGMFNFSDARASELEAALRNELSNINLNNPITKALQELGGVVRAEISFTKNPPGPRNLNINVDAEKRNVTSEDKKDKPHVGDALEKMSVPPAWQIDTGGDAVAAIFDTSFCKEYLDSDRVIDTFSGSDVNSAYSAPEEGHGTMTAYAMAGNKTESGLDYHGVAKDADLLLARLSDSEGGLKYVAEAWDWLAGHVKRLNKPVISNHSYGIPACSANTMGLCDSSETKFATAMNKRPDHQAFYAAGNEALYCGHRVGGVTNGINSINSDPTSITCAAFRYDLLDAQSYSSHGFGTCNSLQKNPKPDLGCLLPDIVPYGCKEKDMSTGQGGSGGGTSLATPLTAGVATMLASRSGTAKQDVIESALEDTAKQVRTTQINIVRGHDARFGNGQVDAKAAIDSLSQ